jgi:hypothetical protein
MSEAIFSGPVIALRGEGVADTPSRAGAVLGVKLFLPETDVTADGGVVLAEQSIQTLRPGKRSGFYIPIPNSIIRSPGSERKIFRALKRAAFPNFRVSFMVLSGIPCVWIFASAWMLRGCLVSLNFGR